VLLVWIVAAAVVRTEFTIKLLPLIARSRLLILYPCMCVRTLIIEVK
jgi:hypothetical protein